MKKTALLILSVFLTVGSLHAQSSAPTCHSSSTEQYAMLGKEKSFIKSHDAPLPYTYHGKGETITYKTPDGIDGSGFLIKNPKPTDNYILVFQEWWGLNDHIKKQAEQLYNDLGNVNILAIDMYDGEITTNADSAGILMSQFSADRGKALVKGALDYVGKKAKVGTIGWCFGGGWSLQASILAEKQGAACVMYYGMPEKDINQLKKLHTEVLGFFASKEKWISPEVVKEFEQNMKAAGEKLTVKFYDADHAFANPSNPGFDKAATEDSWKQTVAFFKKNLK